MSPVFAFAEHRRLLKCSFEPVCLLNGDVTFEILHSIGSKKDGPQQGFSLSSRVPVHVKDFSFKRNKNEGCPLIRLTGRCETLFGGLTLWLTGGAAFIYIRYIKVSARWLKSDSLSAADFKLQFR